MPDADPTPTPTTRPTGDWADVKLPALKPVASLTPTRTGVAGAALDTAFRLTSLDGTAVAKLAADLEVTPKIALARHATTARSMTLTPRSQLTPGVTYRFAVRRADGTIAGAWSITAARALHVVGTLPENESTDVPRNTGIEFTFDQLGVTTRAVRDAFTIRPRTSGRFEAHGKVIAFVPAKPLKARTLYTVTLHKGVPLPGTGQKLGRDVVVRFETRGAGADATQLVIPDVMIDSAVKLPPTISINFSAGEDQPKLPSTLSLTVHRLAGLSAATKAYERLAADPEWARSAGAPIDTGDLPVVLTGSVAVHRYQDEEEGEGDSTWVQLPQTLPAGWYVATLTYDGWHQQVLLQVADIAAYSMVTETRTVVWANDLATARPISGATVEVAGTNLGRTDADGLRVAPTPAVVLKATTNLEHRYVVVRDGDGRTVFVPVQGPGICGKCSDVGESLDPIAIDAWWHVLATDRYLLRTTDQANVWGMVRTRDDGSVPVRVDIRLQAYDDWSGTSIPIVTARATPSAAGVFTATLGFRDVPFGEYQIAMVVDGATLGSSSIHVGSIVKPAWQLAVTTDEHAVIAGSTVGVTATASYFEGTPVAGVAMRMEAGSDDESDVGSTDVRTDTEGRASGTARIDLERDTDAQWDWRSVEVHPTLPEEAAIAGDAWVAAFRSNALLETDATLKGSTLTMTGAVHDVDFGAFEHAVAPDWDIDPNGSPRAGARVTVEVVERIPTRTRIGTRYDFITKTTSPVYRYDERRVSLGTRTATTAADGTIRLTWTVTGGDRAYEVNASYTDTAARTIRTSTYASADRAPQDDAWVRLVAPGSTDESDVRYGTGESVALQVLGGHPVPATDRYLYTVTHLGLVDAAVRADPDYRTTFQPAWIPDATIRAVRFNGTAYEPSEGFQASFDAEERALQVGLTADAARYEPGGTAHVTVRTTDRTGHPVSASVVVQVVDEKIYALGGAGSVNLPWDLYGSVSDGVVAISWSHAAPANGGEGGDTGGGGGDDDRGDFRDWLLFERVTTGTDGRATVPVKLSDDLTSWHVTASAIDTSYRAGASDLALPVGLPFFVETALAQDYLVGDQPVLRVRGYGSALHAGDTVAFTVTSTTLGMTGTSATAPAFTAASIKLPTLPVGSHTLRIAASSGSGASRHEDVLVRTIRVVDTRSVQAKVASGTLTADFRLQGSTTGRTTIILSDGGRGRALPILTGFLGVETGRADQAIASRVAEAVLHDIYGFAGDAISTEPVDLSAFQDYDGVALLPYASADLELTALAALADDPRLDTGMLREALGNALSEATTRERRIVAVAGLAGLGSPVLPEIRAYAAKSKLSTIERSWLAVAAWAAGDETLAGSLERAVLASKGQRLGPWIRVRDGGTETTATTTAILAIAASGIGDPLAADLDAFLAANPPKDTILNLQRAIAARSWAERMPGQPAVATLRVDGTTRRIAVSPSDPTVITLTPAQLASATISPVSGKVIVTSRWEGPFRAGSLRAGDVASFTRSVSPTGTIPVAGLVTVTFTVRLASGADHGCWQVTDLVPSGLAPVWGGSSRGEEEDEDQPADATTIRPWQVEGQRVDFCVALDPEHPVQHLRYVARVVTPGTYRWEPTIIQSSIAPDRGMALPATTLEIAR